MPYRPPGLRSKPAFPELTKSRWESFNPNLPPACFPTINGKQNFDGDRKPATDVSNRLPSPNLVGFDLVQNTLSGLALVENSSKEEAVEDEGENVVWKDGSCRDHFASG